MPFMRCPTCKHTDHATGTEALPCTNPNGCRGIMEPDPGRHGQVPRPAAEYGPSHLAERRAWQAEARARAEVNELAAATSGTPTNDSMDGRVVLPPAARAMLDAAATSSVTTEAEQAAALAALEAARRHEALMGQNRDYCDERCPPPSATLEISVGGDRVDVREVSDDGAVPLATLADLEAARAQLPEIAPPPATSEAERQRKLRQRRADLDRLAELVGIKRGGAARSSETDAALRVRVRDEIVRMAAQPLEAQSALGNAGEHRATHEDGLRAGCLAAIEQVNTILDQLVEVADLCCEPDRTLGDPGEHQRAALIADVVRIVRRRLQDVGV